MYTHSTSGLTVVCLLLFLTGCREPVAPVVYQPSDCGYELDLITYSDPTECTPELTTFRDVGRTTEPEKLPPFPADCAPSGPTLTAYLNGIDDSSFFLHVYKGAPGPVSLEVYGEESCGETVLLTECLTVNALAERFVIKTGGTRYRAFFVRVGLDADFVGQYTPEHFISLSAYEDVEPRSRGGVRYQTGPFSAKEVNDKEELDLPTLAFSCEGNSFQRVLLNACESDAKVIEEWIRELGITPSETYYGEKGNVVVFDVPPGLDPNTTGGSAAVLRPRSQGSGGFAEPDYLINLFNPRDPSAIAPQDNRLRLATNYPQIRRIDQQIDEKYFGEYLPPFRGPVPEDSGEPWVVTIIDSGVDAASPNAALWEPLTYRAGKETEYVKTGTLGFDFIAKDYAPNDLTPHGTYVAGTLMGQYTSERDLDLVHMKIFGHEGISSYFGALVSLYEATAIGSKVINASWGISQAEAPEGLTCAVETALHEGIYLITSAGNDSLDIGSTPQWPAAYAPTYPSQIVATASYWYRGELEKREPDAVELMDFSNYSKLTVPLAGYMTTPVPNYLTGQIVYPLGTSFTAPLVAGTFLNWWSENPGSVLADFQHACYRKASPLTGQIVNGHHLPAKVNSGGKP